LQRRSVPGGARWCVPCNACMPRHARQPLNARAALASAARPARATDKAPAGSLTLTLTPGSSECGKAHDEPLRSSARRQLAKANQPEIRPAPRAQVHNMTIRAKGKLLLDSTLLTVTAGRRYGLVGPNGMGKSTLLRMIARRQVPVPEGLDVLLVEQARPGPAFSPSRPPAARIRTVCTPCYRPIIAVVGRRRAADVPWRCSHAAPQVCLGCMRRREPV